MKRSLPLRRRSWPRSYLPVLASLLALSSGCSDHGGDGVSDPDAPGVVDVPGGGSGGRGSSTWAEVPPLRDPVALDDDALARQALALLGSSAVGSDGSCRSCHSLGRPTLTLWSRLSRDFSDACLDDPRLDDQAAVDAMLACFRSQSGGQYAPEAFGIYSAAAHLPWFDFVFGHASGLPNRQQEEANFLARVGMPRAGERWSQGEFDIVAEWFARGAPRLFEIVPEDSGEECTPGLQPLLAQHVQELGTSGWRARNAQASLLDFDCDQGQTGSACLGSFPLAGAAAGTSVWEALGGSQIRVLYDNSESPTTYWSRSSADGRYIAAGLQNFDDEQTAGQIVDLQQNRVIVGNFRYDATFFPDNSGFVVQQGGGNDGGSETEPSDGVVSAGETALTCDQSVLDGDPEVLTGDEPECRQISGRLGLYQQLAKSLDGEDYWVIHGSYTSDNGGFEPVLNNPSAAYEADSTITLTPLVNLGNGFQAESPVRVATPRQGDPMLSPSGGLLVTRVKGRELDLGEDLIAAEQSGYALYRLNTAPSAGSWSATLSDAGRICVQGGKPSFSFDERWLVFHHYVIEPDATELGFSSASAAGFRPYLEQGSSNLYLADLTSGELHRITHMPPGEFALFPHFRSDGWIYFVVRTLDRAEYFAASDGALVLEGQD